MDKKKPMKGITCCGDCVYYRLRKHKCKRCNCIKSGPGNPFYDDCPLPDVIPDSTLGIVQTIDSISFIATGDAKKGQERGELLGKGIMYEHIEKELLYKGLLTEDVRNVIRSVYHNLIEVK